MKNEKQVTFRQAFSLNFRAFQILRKKCRGLFESIFCNAAVTAVIPYAGIYFSARILNELAGNRRPEILWKWVVLTVTVTALTALLKAATVRWKNSREALFYHNQIEVYNNKMLQMDFCVLDEQHTHDIYSQICQNTNGGGWGFYKIYYIFERMSNAAVSVFCAMILSLSLFTQYVPETSKYAFLNSPFYILAFLGIMAVIVVLAPFCSTKAKNYMVTKGVELNKFGNRLFFFFFGSMNERKRMLDMRMYNQQEISKTYMSTYSPFRADSIFGRYDKGKIGGLMALSAAISTVFTGFAYLFVCLKAWAGAFGVGSVTQYVGAITALARGISDLMHTIGDLKNNAAFLQVSFEFLDLPDRMYQGSLTTEKRSDRQYEVEFRDVSFRYPGSEEYALRHVSMKFKIGKRLAVVGRNGSGKTTFIKLLCRLYDPTEGEILLNGIDIRKYKYEDYLQVFAVVFQDFQLLAFPLGQNVAAAQNYDRKRAESCLRMAGFGDRLDRMPDGLDTCLYREFDEKGVEISGGEAQKIALARALYKDAPFIVLDEPTAALDPIAEHEVYSHFDELVTDKTAIYISHRLSSCRFCDEIAVFEKGQVVQQGSHESLLAEKDGKYAELWFAQAQYYAEKEREILLK
ncbi:MAG: ABC transporter ATP-binding protein [Candidatus Merdivicinus sp.]